MREESFFKKGARCFNLIFVLEESPVLVSVAAHLRMVGGGIWVFQLLHKPRDHTEIEARDRIPVMGFQCDDNTAFC